MTNNSCNFNIIPEEKHIRKIIEGEGIEYPYYARVINNIETKPGCWNYLDIGIFKNGEQVGYYQRNYSSLHKTFYPFIANDGQWYALYSKDYTATRIMRLSDCKDMGGEEGNGAGFCPVEFYVPLVCNRDNKEPPPENITNGPEWRTILSSGWIKYPGEVGYTGNKTKEEYNRLRDQYFIDYDTWDKKYPIYTRFADFGFVAGCHWGDDGSWKVQFLDLSNAHNGILIRDDRFGRHELPDNVSLIDSISIIPKRDVKTRNVDIEIAFPKRYLFDGKEESI